jgi:hypothetical protein
MPRHSKAFDRLKRLSVHTTDEVWEVALASIPVVVAEGDKRSRGPDVPYRPMVALCISNKGGAQMTEPDRPKCIHEEILLDALVAFAYVPLLPGTKPLTYLPSRIALRAKPLVKDLSARLRMRLASIHDEDVEGQTPAHPRGAASGTEGVETSPPEPLWQAAVGRFMEAAKSLGVLVELKHDSPLAEEFLDGFARASEDFERSPELERDIDDMMRGPMRAPALVKSKGMTVERIRSFARAAAAFHKAAPWRHSDSEIIWRIDPAPKSRALRYCTVIGAMGEEFGLAFFTHPDQVLDADPDDPSEFFESAGGTVWSVLFDREEFIPSPDASLWREHGLPRTADGSCPIPIGYRAGPTRGTMSRPSSEQLSDMEAVLMAFAEATRKEVVAGTIRADVETFDGPRALVFTAEVTF